VWTGRTITGGRVVEVDVTDRSVVPVFAVADRWPGLEAVFHAE
jgi:hypothetical protein